MNIIGKSFYSLKELIEKSRDEIEHLSRGAVWGKELNTHATSIGIDLHWEIVDYKNQIKK